MYSPSESTLTFSCHSMLDTIRSCAAPRGVTVTVALRCARSEPAVHTSVRTGGPVCEVWAKGERPKL